MNSLPSGDSAPLPVIWAGNQELPTASIGNSKRPGTEDGDFVVHLEDQESADIGLLFDRYSRLVFGTAQSVLRDPSEAEEVVQEVFFYLYRKSDCFNPEKGSLKAWIIQITFSRAFDRKSYLARRGFYAGEDLDSLELEQGTDLEQQVDTKLSRDLLERALTELTDMQRQTIRCFYFEELELREISELLRKPLGTVRHHLYRGLERLRKSSVLHAAFVNKLF